MDESLIVSLDSRTGLDPKSTPGFRMEMCTGIVAPYEERPREGERPARQEAS
jgi:hypothetical protein